MQLIRKVVAAMAAGRPRTSRSRPGGSQPKNPPPQGSPSDQNWTDPACPVARTLDLVGDRWSLLIVRDAIDGASAFGDFQQRLGIARNVLTDRLRRLVERGILARRTAASGKRQIYELTPAGQDLFTVIVTMRQWGERHAFAPGEQHSTLVDERGQPVPELTARDEDGRALDAGTTRVCKRA